jgi:hypothetical protein
MIQVDCAGTKLLVGKGDVNTMFYQFGTDERQANYPDWVLEHLETLGSQPFTRYEVVDTDGEVLNSYWSLARLKRRLKPEIGTRVVGVRGLNHELERELVLIVNRDRSGANSWQTAKGTKQFARFKKEQEALAAARAETETDDESDDDDVEDDSED